MFPYRSLWNRLKLTNYSLSVVLLVPFVLLITGTVGLVSYFSFRNGQKAVNDLSSQLRQEILARIDRELEAYFSVPHNINQLSTIAFLQEELDWDTGEGAQQFLEQLRISPYIDIALESILLFCESHYAFLLQYDFTHSHFSITHHQIDPGLSSEQKSILSLQTEPISSQYLPWIYQQCYSGAGISLNTLENLPRAAHQEREILDKTAIQSLLIVPTLYQDRITGGIGLASLNPRQWEEEDCQFLQLIGEFLAMALARRSAEEALLREQEKAERLLLNVLPAPIVNRLKHSPGVIADEFESVSILFADIVGFTTLASRLEPGELVDLLNEIFSQFDTLAAQLKLEKIKTIGDAYMVAAGLPTPRADHAQAIAEMALKMQEIIENISIKIGFSPGLDQAFNPSVNQPLDPGQGRGKQPLQIRTGINTGKVVAGVIGTHKFVGRYG